MTENTITKTQTDRDIQWQATEQAMQDIWDKVTALANPQAESLIQGIAQQGLWEIVKGTYDTVYETMRADHDAKNAFVHHIQYAGEDTFEGQRSHLRMQSALAGKQYVDAFYVHQQAKILFQRLTGNEWAITIAHSNTETSTIKETDDG